MRGRGWLILFDVVSAVGALITITGVFQQPISMDGVYHHLLIALLSGIFGGVTVKLVMSRNESRT